jgi:hypothetical protein
MFDIKKISVILKNFIKQLAVFKFVPCCGSNCDTLEKGFIVKCKTVKTCETAFPLHKAPRKIDYAGIYPGFRRDAFNHERNRDGGQI